MYKLTAADYADTGQWRLTVLISREGLQGILRNTLHDDTEPVNLCEVKWEEGGSLKEKIENAVYENPRLLDDFSTKIILYDPKTLFLPAVEAEEQTGFEEEQYCKIYPGEKSDVMSDRYKDLIAVWSMGSGVKSFLYRTFPGSKITCNLLEKVKETIHKNEVLALNIYRRSKTGEADFVLANRESLLSASTHNISEEKDIEELISKISGAYDLEKDDIEIKFLYE